MTKASTDRRDTSVENEAGTGDATLVSNDASVAALHARIAELEAEVQRMDTRAVELENEVAQRGVKLSCANIALARAKIAFDETSRTREEAVQDIAHDLRTPMTSIKGAAQNLLDGVVEPLTPGNREYVEIIQRQSERLIKVINWLVEAMRISGGPVEMAETPVDLCGLVKGTIDGLQPIADTRTITMRYHSTCPSLIQADAVKLQRVIENLVGNALKFTEPGGSVDIHTEQRRHGFVVRVCDTGIGMEAGVVDRIFDRYYRKDSQRDGKGLGLLIARDVARKHGGDITVTSKPGEGSEFVLHLPLPV